MLSIKINDSMGNVNYLPCMSFHNADVSSLRHENAS